jgi:hypothetical protein
VNGGFSLSLSSAFTYPRVARHSHAFNLAASDHSLTSITSTTCVLCTPCRYLLSVACPATAASPTSALSLALVYSSHLALGEDLLRLPSGNGARPRRRGGGNAASPLPAHPSLLLVMMVPLSRTPCAVPEANLAFRTAISIDGEPPRLVGATSPTAANRQSPSLR